jgi:hypothetical protein
MTGANHISFCFGHDSDIAKITIYESAKDGEWGVVVVVRHITERNEILNDDAISFSLFLSAVFVICFALPPFTLESYSNIFLFIRLRGIHWESERDDFQIFVRDLFGREIF